MVEPDTACNVYTFSDTRMTWFSQDLTSYYWTYYRKNGVDKKREIDGKDFEEGKLCAIDTDTASSYEKG